MDTGRDIVASAMKQIATKIVIYLVVCRHKSVKEVIIIPNIKKYAIKAHVYKVRQNVHTVCCPDQSHAVSTNIWKLKTKSIIELPFFVFLSYCILSKG